MKQSAARNEATVAAPAAALLDAATSTTLKATSRRACLQIVDTTLLKCYLLTNDALVASLLRLRDNNCHLEESEQALRRHHKHTELVILYQVRIVTLVAL